ncbi:MAG TPA: flavodoxin domain-containing protein [Flavitalea sp.]|nr:flavodoxin domain-containing protein [Flavitalea sp.]
MLADNKWKQVQELVATATREELIWINGYLAGVIGNELPAPAIGKPAVSKITIAYGTETGNSKRLASAFAGEAKSKGITPKLVSLDQYRLNDLQKEEYFFAIISTQGDGEPPAAAKKFYDHIHHNGFKAEKLKYGVLALGDTSYPLFCKAGEDVDVQLQKLGGERVVDLAKCDVDYETEAKGWIDGVLSKLAGAPAPAVSPVYAPKKSSGKQVFTGSILTSLNLNDRGSNKETYHIEISAPEIQYQPGDSLGLIPYNDEKIVAAILQELNADGEAEYQYKDASISFRDLLTKKLNIAHLPGRVVTKYADLVKQEIPTTDISLLEIIRIYSLPAAFDLQELVNILEPIAPRLYSIASSMQAHPDEIHITVSRNRFSVNGEWKFGLCSDFLACQPVGSSFEFYIHPNNRFRLPAAEKDIIMVGPGTGIAPFRSFLADRDAAGATGKNWLFFGEQHFTSDFLYQTELQNWYETGVLSKVNLAFSRDQEEKIYVQHKMLENGAELFKWLETGATMYICGAKDPMSNDVEKALLQIVQVHGDKNEADAAEYLEKLKEEDRLLLDVY